MEMEKRRPIFESLRRRISFLRIAESTSVQLKRILTGTSKARRYNVVVESESTAASDRYEVSQGDKSVAMGRMLG